MVLTSLDMMLAATIVGWLIALCFVIAFYRRGAAMRQNANQAADSLSRIEGELRMRDDVVLQQQARLEAMDGLRDDLNFAQNRVTELQTRETALATRLEERERHLAELQSRLENEFRSMSTKLVRETGDALLREAAQSFEKQHLVARKDAETYSKSVSDLLKPMRDTLTRYEEGLRDMRDHQKRAQGELTGQIETLAKSASAVQAEAQSLASALKAGPRTRGRWGETTLRNVVEMTGMTEYCDFSEQFSVTNDENGSRKQPDMVVSLPGERVVAIDSKVSLNAWLDHAEAKDDVARRATRDGHAKSVWTHVQQLAAKDYASALRKSDSLDFVVMFVPGESFFSAAIETRPTLFQDAFDKGVLLATPATLIAILKSISHAWRQQKASDNAREVAKMAEELYTSLRSTGGYLSGLGKSLGKSVEEYNKLVGNMEVRVLPRARRFAELDMPGTEKPIDAVIEVDHDPREPSQTRDFLFEPPLAIGHGS